MTLRLGNRRHALTAIGLIVTAMSLAGCWIVLSSFQGTISATNSVGASTPILQAGKRSHDGVFDPTLEYAKLKATENEAYRGTGRNVFRMEKKMQLQKSSLLREDFETSAPGPTAEPLGPPIPLQFFGVAAEMNRPMRVCFRREDTIFVASEGQIVDGRYKVLRIDGNSVEVEHLIERTVHTLVLPG